MAVAAQAAGQPFSIGWRATDNTTTTFDGPRMIALGADVATYFAALFANYQALAVEIEALASVADCDAFDVTQRWPDN